MWAPINISDASSESAHPAGDNTEPSTSPHFWATGPAFPPQKRIRQRLNKAFTHSATPILVSPLHPGSVAQLRSAAQHLQLGFTFPLIHLSSVPSKSDHPPCTFPQAALLPGPTSMSEIQRESTAGPEPGPVLAKSRTCLLKAELLFTKVPTVMSLCYRLHFPQICAMAFQQSWESALYYLMILDFCTIIFCNVVSPS